MEIRLANPLCFDSIVDGPGLRCVIWAQGCLHECPGCHNPQTHPLLAGEKSDTSVIIEQIKTSKLQSGITLSGGEPFLQCEPLIEILHGVEDLHLNVWAYSGYTFEEIIANPTMMHLLELVDVLVDGRFRKDLQNYELRFKGSSNQRLIDVSKSLATKKVIEIT